VKENGRKGSENKKIRSKRVKNARKERIESKR
jgi:hypothetical protein